MRRGLAWLAGALGAAGLAWLRRRRKRAPAADPAEDLRRTLAEAREAAGDPAELDDRELPVDQVDVPGTIDERRRAVHEKAQEALDAMRRPPGE